MITCIFNYWANLVIHLNLKPKELHGKGSNGIPTYTVRTPYLCGTHMGLWKLNRNIKNEIIKRCTCLIHLPGLLLRLG